MEKRKKIESTKSSICFQNKKKFKNLQTNLWKNKQNYIKMEMKKRWSYKCQKGKKQQQHMQSTKMETLIL